MPSGRPGGAPENLINFRDRSKEELSEIGRRAAMASAESRRRKKSMREWAQVIGDEEIVNANGDKMTRNGVILLQQYKAALNGDLKAAKFIAELLGQLDGNSTKINILGQDITLKFDE